MSVSRSRSSDSDRGAILILVMVFILALGLSLVAIGTLATNSMKNTVNFRSQRTALTDAENIVTVSAQYLKNNYTTTALGVGFYNTALQTCPTYSTPTIPSADPSGSTAAISVVCQATQLAAGSSPSRIVDFYAYQCSGCTSGLLVLHAQVEYNDNPVSGSASCGLTAGGTISNATCGEAMTVSTWDEALADG